MFHSNSKINPSSSLPTTTTICDDEILLNKQYTSTAKPYEQQLEEEKEKGNTNNKNVNVNTDVNTCTAVSEERINPYTINKAFEFVLNHEDLIFYVESYSLVIQSITSK